MIKHPIVVDFLKKQVQKGDTKYYTTEDAKISIAREHYTKISQCLERNNKIKGREQRKRNRARR